MYEDRLFTLFQRAIFNLGAVDGMQFMMGRRNAPLRPIDACTVTYKYIQVMRVL